MCLNWFALLRLDNRLFYKTQIDIFTLSVVGLVGCSVLGSFNAQPNYLDKSFKQFSFI